MAPEGHGTETGTDVIDPAAGGPTAAPATEHGRGEAAAAGERHRAPEDPRGARPAASWELPAEPRSAARARALTARTLDAWHVTDPGDVADIVLIVDELVTNAVVHGTGPVRLGLRLDGGRLTGEVGDTDPAAPGPARPAPPVLDWAEAGRGLLLVTALATGFGARPHPAGKTVWFTRDLHQPGGHRPTANTPVTAGAAPARN
ncbi:ATP-binding protein [Actinomadura violacea]|uniref:ATP-binding protein n=1 Tax=Actinomadura violacea TaxID=2819934 RepID=A0ABS3RVT2_9ACTN|nr:ATP-binding protein [Actinomadura violacea]MBO2460871.1 ATP-binding protein [Actinomadura violacea]